MIVGKHTNRHFYMVRGWAHQHQAAPSSRQHDDASKQRIRPPKAANHLLTATATTTKRASSTNNPTTANHQSEERPLRETIFYMKNKSDRSGHVFKGGRTHVMYYHQGCELPMLRQCALVLYSRHYGCRTLLLVCSLRRLRAASISGVHCARH